jgi:hypothetical protein
MKNETLEKAYKAVHNVGFTSDTKAAMDAAWNESNHPRAANGEFGSGGSGGNGPEVTGKELAEAMRSGNKERIKAAQVAYRESRERGEREEAESFVRKKKLENKSRKIENSRKERLMGMR